jgi:alcohol dehydrogenase, propanol-preferring
MEGSTLFVLPVAGGDFINCQNAKITGISYDGGYAEYMVAPQEALALVPDQLKAAEGAPLLCAGITTFNALSHSVAKPGDLVAVQGLGGLGHLGIQFANRFGFRTVAVSRSKDKEHLAREVGRMSISIPKPAIRPRNSCVWEERVSC